MDTSDRRAAVVTGASGHIGYHVALELLERQIPVVLLARRENPAIADLLARGATCRLVDLLRPETFALVLAEAKVLFHLAAENTTDRSDRQRVLDGTAGLARSVITAAAEAGVPTIIYTSSVVVLGRSGSPRVLLDETARASTWESPYVEGKVRAEGFCDQVERDRALDLRRLYPSWVVGLRDLRQTPPHQVVARFLSKGQRFYFDGGISIADVRAVARAHVECWLRGRPGGRYVLGGDNLTFQQFFALLAQITGRRPPVIKLPKGAIVLAADVLGAVLPPLGLTPPLDPAYARSVIGSFSYYDSSKAVRDLGYAIPPARQSLESAVRGERQRNVGTHLLGLRRPARADAGGGAGTAADLPPVLITGVPGWLGNTLLDQLINGTDASASSPAWVPAQRRIHLLVEPRSADLLDLPPNIRIFPGDILDTAAVDAALEGVHSVFHLAGAIYPSRIRTLYRVNAEGTRHIVDRCIAKGVRRILYAGTDSICGHGTPQARLFSEDQPARPYRHYGQSKFLGESYLLEKSRAGLIDGTSLRAFWFFGPFAPPRQLRFLEMLRHWPRQLVFGNGRNYRSITHVADMAGAFLAAEFQPRTHGKWYWIGDPRPDYTVDDIYRLLCSAVGSEFRPLHLPCLVCTMARAADWLLSKVGRLHPTIHAMGKMDFDIAGPTIAAERDFGYKPRHSLAQNPGGMIA